MAEPTEVSLGAGRTARPLPVRLRTRREPWLFAASLTSHLALLGLLFALTEVRLGTYEYEEIARNLTRGEFVLRSGEPPVLWRPPLYIYFLAGIYRLFGHGYLPVVIVQAGMAAATAVVAYRIGTRLFGDRVGVVTAVVVTGHPLLWYNAGRVM